MFVEFLGTEIDDIASVHQIAIIYNKIGIIIQMIIVLFIDPIEPSVSTCKAKLAVFKVSIIRSKRLSIIFFFFFLVK